MPGHETRRDLLPEPTDGFVWRQVPRGLVLTCPPLDAFARHLFTTRELSPGARIGGDAAWELVASYLELPGDALVGLKQVHGCRTLRVQGSGDRAVAREPADAAIADADDVGLVIKTADCVPILLADRLGRGVGAVHAGWRGTALWLAGSTAEALAGACGGCAEELVAAIGPSIGACCYEVGPEVRETFEAQAPSPAAGSAIARWLTAGAGDRLRLDLWEANRDQLIAAGVPASSIHVARLCTACHLDRFFSYRREGTRAGRLLAAIRRR